MSLSRDVFSPVPLQCCCRSAPWSDGGLRIPHCSLLYIPNILSLLKTLTVDVSLSLIRTVRVPDLLQIIQSIILFGLVMIPRKYHLPVPLVIFACFLSTKCPSVSPEKKKRCIFPLMKGICPRTISSLGTTDQSCLCWSLVLMLIVHQSLPSSPWLEQHQLCAFAKYSYNPGSLACLATPWQALREAGVMPRGKQPSAPPSVA